MKLRAGFTLLELLVAVAVLGMLILLLEQGLAFGVRATAMQLRATERQGDADAADRALRQLISRADPGVYPEPATLRGGGDAVALITELPDPATGRRERVSAKIYASGGQLRLQWAPARHVDNFGAPLQMHDAVLLSGIRAAQFTYFGPTGWTPNWAAEHLPALVQLKITFGDDARHWPPLVIALQREALEQ